jgi:hypothetical protein
MADTYDIVNIAPRTRSAPGGIFTKVQEVTFTTKPSGLTGQIDIPADMFTPEHVNELVTEQARTIEAVKAL